MQRQDYNCLDSSEAFSDDSHLTRDSITRESQNDELSSSTLDKIDVSTLPLPAIPQKKRRQRQRSSPGKHHARRHENIPSTGETEQIASPKLDNSNSTVKSQSAFEEYVAKRRNSLEASNRSFIAKLEARKMHYHVASEMGTATGSSGVPTYLFGEHCNVEPSSSKYGKSPKEEIYLNKSGWVQVNSKRNLDDYQQNKKDNFYLTQNADKPNIRVIQIDNSRRSNMARQALLQHQYSFMEAPNYGYRKPMASKVEELIQRNEARLNHSAQRDNTLRPGYRIVDPQLANLLNERPGFLPVKHLAEEDSPPPITPILSPPPAFQDNSNKTKQYKPKPTTATSDNSAVNAKGMVFSRSFEYDNRRSVPSDTYVETFSRSFDGNLLEQPHRNRQPRERSPNFSTLTGNSPNFLSKKESAAAGGSSGSLRSREGSPKYQQPQITAYINASIKEAPPTYSTSLLTNSNSRHSPRAARHERSFERAKSHSVTSRSRKSQFNRVGSSGSNYAAINSAYAVGNVSRFRSFEAATNQRLNSCDSGARSGNFFIFSFMRINITIFLLKIFPMMNWTMMMLAQQNFLAQTTMAIHPIRQQDRDLLHRIDKNLIALLAAYVNNVL